MQQSLRPTARDRHTFANTDGLFLKDAGTRPDPKTVSGDETYALDGQLGGGDCPQGGHAGTRPVPKTVGE